MVKSLIVVESPAKAATIKKYLGDNFSVTACYGHIKDLPKNRLGVDVEISFLPRLEVIKGKQKVVNQLKVLGKKVDQIFLAPDPDREGEAIAWHIAEEISKVNDKILRVRFNEITARGIKAGMDNPIELNKMLYDAQLTRRILDRLVGYRISPILWKKIQKGLSAGRVQSVVVKLIVDREAEIKAFVPEEYWTLEAELKGNSDPEFITKLHRIGKKKAKIVNGDEAKTIVEQLDTLPFVVEEISTNKKEKKPLPPYITSRLQQDAANRYHFSTKKTMSLAQRLYEGIDVGSETAGLITYMRTDSTRISEEALGWARQHIKDDYGDSYLPDKARIYSAKKGSQDAHEAIRPTTADYPPQKIKKYLSSDQFKLYSLIWNRFIASQMANAVYHQTVLDILAGKYWFRMTGMVLKFNGFQAVYGTSGNKGDKVFKLPPLQKGDVLELVKLNPLQHFTQPSPRFTEGSLVRELEEKGIGRPSTYAPIISTIQARKYVLKNSGYFVPTELGQVVTGLLEKSFPNIMDVGFTAEMEGQLDSIEEGKCDRIKVLEKFYNQLEKLLVTAEKEMRNLKTEEMVTDIDCPKCRKKMNSKWGRNGPYLACSGYPDCRTTMEYYRNDQGDIVPVTEEVNETCPRCGENLLVKRGRFGRFLACANYPKCSFSKPMSIGVKCPQENCGGTIFERQSRAGKIFYGCSNFPKCNFASWNKPINKQCPTCQSPILVEKSNRQGYKIWKCFNKKCNYQIISEK